MSSGRPPSRILARIIGSYRVPRCEALLDVLLGRPREELDVVLDPGRRLVRVDVDVPRRARVDRGDRRRRAESPNSSTARRLTSAALTRAESGRSCVAGRRRRSAAAPAGLPTLRRGRRLGRGCRVAGAGPTTDGRRRVRARREEDAAAAASESFFTGTTLSEYPFSDRETTARRPPWDDAALVDERADENESGAPVSAPRWFTHGANRNRRLTESQCSCRARDWWRSERPSPRRGACRSRPGSSRRGA